MTAPSLSLYKIDLELLELMHAREDVESSSEMTPQEIEASLAAIDAEVTGYLVKALANKTDVVVNYVRECEKRAEVDRAESGRLKDKAAAWDTQREYLEYQVLMLMQRSVCRSCEGRQQAKPCKECGGLGYTKRVEGQHHKFVACKNPPSCEVAQPDMVPGPYMRTTITLSPDLLNRLLNHLMTTEKGAPIFQDLMQCKQSPAEPVKSEILRELKQPCPNCQGKWDEMPGQIHATVCGVCGGSGRNSVPGCRLKDDSVRLEIR